MSITYYSIVEIFFSSSARVSDVQKCVSGDMQRQRAHANTLFTPAHKTLATHFDESRARIRKCRLEYLVRVVDGPTLLTKQRREDPLFVTFDPVERQHRISFAATRNTNEWTTRIVTH